MGWISKFVLSICAALIISCSPSTDKAENALNKTIIYSAITILTLDEQRPVVQAIAVADGRINAVGTLLDLQTKFPHAKHDKSFEDKVLVPGLIDPHVHMILGAMMYAKPFAPPWDVQTPWGIVKGLPSRASFLARIAEVNSEQISTKPLVIYGFHNLVHGALDKHDLDKITADRPLIIWHYSGHDFYLNSKALEYAKIDASWAEKFEGVPLGADGKPTGRVFEDAVFRLLNNVGTLFLAPPDIKRGFDGLEDMFAQNGVTTVAEMGYGLFGLKLEDLYYKTLLGPNAKTKVYLVPEHRAFDHAFTGEVIPVITKMVADTKDSWPRVLPQVKLFTDAAFYSQTMRLKSPGYTGGQSKGHKGLWVTGPDILTDIMRPYWRAGLDIHIHSNGDAAQDASLDGLEAVQQGGTQEGQRLILEHVGLITPKQLGKAAQLGAGVSVASHYVHYMGKTYEDAIGERVKFMTPLASSFKAGLPTTMHSDAPLAPPSPLTAASVHMLRSTREGGVSIPTEKLTREQALRAITLDAAWSLGLESEIGSIEVGKQADFTVLGANPLNTNAEDWPYIQIWGVVLDGVVKPLKN